MGPHELIARNGILNALAIHSRGVDRADLNLLSAAYHPQATVDYGFFKGPAETLCTILAEAQKPTLPTLHRTSNAIIRVKGEQAISESYVIAYAEEVNVQRFILGRYLDRHACRDGQWRLTHRTYVLDGNANRSNAAERADPPVLHDNLTPYGGKGASDAGRAMLTYYEASSRHLQKAKPMTADPAALDAAISRMAIHDLVTAYCRGVDRGDASLLASIFWEDSTVISGIVNGSGAQFAEKITAYCTSNLGYCFHSVSNEWIEVSGNHGVGEHYVIAHMTSSGTDVMTGGRYLDSYERRDGVWKIKNRTFVSDWNTHHPTTMQTDGFYAPLDTRGSFGRGDPIYDHWASL
ncbi:MAG: nuclear transport factor 2 family protein [Rhodospirillaceae bacterium]|nr:MAG: nuclear transport factor 2 family protein [Rhodospirillaceae bacterium]